MSRALRVEYAGACYHVINRGNYRRALFTGEGAAEAFIRTLGEAAVKYHWRVHAYVVMSNHFHLAVELTEPNLGEGMKWLQGTWIRRYNGFRKLIGRPFQGRYKALLVEPGHALGQVCHYIHLNPVRAGIIGPAEAGSYPWSSLAGWTKKDRPAWLESATVLREAGGLPDSVAGWKSYLGYLEFVATDATMKKELIAKRLSRGWCVGSREFKHGARQAVAQRGADLERDKFGGSEPEELKAERAERWEEILRAFAEGAGVDLTTLTGRKSQPEKVLLAAAMKQSTSVSNGWLAERLGMGKPASASQFTRRLLLTAKGKAAVERLLKHRNDR